MKTARYRSLLRDCSCISHDLETREGAEETDRHQRPRVNEGTPCLWTYEFRRRRRAA